MCLKGQPRGQQMGGALPTLGTLGARPPCLVMCVSWKFFSWSCPDSCGGLHWFLESALWVMSFLVSAEYCSGVGRGREGWD